MDSFKVLILLLVVCGARSNIYPEEKDHTEDEEVVEVFNKFDQNAGFHRRLMTQIAPKSEECFFIENLQANAHLA